MHENQELRLECFKLCLGDGRSFKEILILARELYNFVKDGDIRDAT